jgi:hypothetical protein
VRGSAVFVSLATTSDAACRHVGTILHGIRSRGQGEAHDGYREVFRKFDEPVFKPLLAVVVSVAQRERATNTARHAVGLAG